MSDAITCPDCGSTDIAFPPEDIPAKDVLCIDCGWQFNPENPIGSETVWDAVEDDVLRALDEA